MPSSTRVLLLAALLLGLTGAVSSSAWAGQEGGADSGWLVDNLAAPPNQPLDLSLPEGSLAAEPSTPTYKRTTTSQPRYLSPADRWSKERRESYELDKLLLIPERE